jgi:hypothetical protein
VGDDEAPQVLRRTRCPKVIVIVFFCFFAAAGLSAPGTFACSTVRKIGPEHGYKIQTISSVLEGVFWK